jgi:hypothetical protein
MKLLQAAARVLVAALLLDLICRPGQITRRHCDVFNVLYVVELRHLSKMDVQYQTEHLQPNSDPIFHNRLSIHQKRQSGGHPSARRIEPPNHGFTQPRTAAGATFCFEVRGGRACDPETSPCCAAQSPTKRVGIREFLLDIGAARLNWGAHG